MALFFRWIRKQSYLEINKCARSETFKNIMIISNLGKQTKKSILLKIMHLFGQNLLRSTRALDVEQL